MTTFLWILLSGVAMTAIALVGSITLILRESTLNKLLLPLVAFAAGSLLGGALFHMLPAALTAMPVLTASTWVAFGFVVFLILEQLLHWHHCHRASADCRKPLTYLILIGDGLLEEHYAQAQAARRAVVQGDLAAYHRAAAWLAEHELSGSAPENWRHHAAALQDVAKAGRDAPDLAAAAAAVGQLGAACAACHEQLGRPDLPSGEPPAAASGASPHMARHQWAADRLWDGLITPSDELWVKGAEALAEAPLEPSELAPGQSVPPQVPALADEVHSLAQAARTAPGAERGSAYGAFLRTCSSCHEALAVRLK